VFFETPKVVALDRKRIDEEILVGLDVVEKQCFIEIEIQFSRIQDPEDNHLVSRGD
jgi:hypothetical protein